MGLRSNPRELFSQAWVDNLKGVPESAMSATILLYNPNVSGDVYDPETDTWITVPQNLYSGKARVQPLRSANRTQQGGNETTVQTTLVSIPIDEALALDIRPGYQVDVITAPLNPSLLGYQLVVSEIMDSSNPIERTFMCTVDQETHNG